MCGHRCDPSSLALIGLFADASVCANEPPLGSQVMTTAMVERCALSIVDEPGAPRPQA